jgi:hypothetical protein
VLQVDGPLDQQVPLPTRRGRQAPGRKDGSDAFRVVDDFPRPVPVSRAELAVIETHLGKALDALLREFGG